MYFYGFRERQTHGPPRAAQTLATPLSRGLTDVIIALWRTWYVTQQWRSYHENFSFIVT